MFLYKKKDDARIRKQYSNSRDEMLKLLNNLMLSF